MGAGGWTEVRRLLLKLSRALSPFTTRRSMRSSTSACVASWVDGSFLPLPSTAIILDFWSIPRARSLVGVTDFSVSAVPAPVSTAAASSMPLAQVADLLPEWARPSPLFGPNLYGESGNLGI